ncbi:response regulator [Asticcacaulis sp. AC402]|uniref:response regulator n=1 Tax=Asticcacaulis sp. AC402 TaxID=1282361 RepID=UPI0003C3C853|nr:response regulator [Asticcacaulis sp. AC402]ESQ76252.1 histidine kinase [Asticcacaulis sp. AC402]
MRSQLDILLVEDNEGDVEMTRRALTTAVPPVRMTVANNGNQALECLHKEGAFEGARTPDLILLDINMPRMDGKQFLNVVKESSEFKSIPVVMFTSSESPTDIRECFERHANGYVVKPFDGAQYANTLRQVVTFWGSTSELPS